MKIITLNIWGGKIKDKLLDFFKQHSNEVDIFCLQEVFDNGKSTREIYQNENMNIFGEIQAVLNDHVGYFHPSEGDEEGLAIFVKKNIEVESFGDFFAYRWKDAMENNDSATMGRNLSYISINSAGKKLLVANFHGLWNGMGKLDSDDRLSQSRKIKDFLNNRNEECKIIMGDFNLRPETESVKMLENNMRNLIKDYKIESTRTSLYPKSEKFADYVFITPNIEVRDFRVLPDEVSDHAALLMEI